MGQFMMTNQGYAVRGIRRTTLKSQVNLGLVSLMMVIFFLITVMGLISLTSLNSQATKGYEINKLEAERAELVSDSEANDKLILDAMALDTISQSAIVKSMVRPGTDEIAYVAPLTTIASRAYGRREDLVG
ncbi:MAG: hypothetical protein WCT46_02825 [Candidatus Gracilibacteria bacterium]